MIGKMSSIVICLLLFQGAISEIAPAESQTIQTQIEDPISETYPEMDPIDLSGIDGYFTENLSQ